MNRTVINFFFKRMRRGFSNKQYFQDKYVFCRKNIAENKALRKMMHSFRSHIIAFWVYMNFVHMSFSLINWEFIFIKNIYKWDIID